jgi:DNA-binding GntR family transcriptional regulator
LTVDNQRHLSCFLEETMKNNSFLLSFDSHEALPDRIYSTLEEAILEGKIKPGDRLIEDELSKGFGVSRGPIREALRLLEKDGLVKRVPRKGAIVEWISKDDISEMFQVRSVLEGLAAKIFCGRVTDEELSKLEEIYRQMEAEVEKKNTLKYRRLNREFHSMIIRGSRNRKILEIAEKYEKQIRWFQKMALSSVGRPEISLREHKAILAAFLRRQPEDAEREVRKHLEHASTMFEGMT